MRVYLFVLASIYLNITVSAQNTRLVGTVYDEEGRTIGECKVALLVNTKGKYYSTDSLGKFIFSMQCDKIDTLVIEKKGYCPLQVSDIDPAFVNSKNELVFYLKKENNSEGAFLSSYPKKFLGITYKKVLEHNFFNYSSCCSPMDTSYYQGEVLEKLSDDLLTICYFNTYYSEILKSTQDYYNNNTDSIYLEEIDGYMHITHLIDSASPCKISEHIVPYYDRTFQGGAIETYARYLKMEIVKQNIVSEDSIVINFILEHPFGYSNINVTGVDKQDEDKIVKIVEESPRWSLPRSNAPKVRLHKHVIIDMTDIAPKD